MLTCKKADAQLTVAELTGPRVDAAASSEVKEGLIQLIDAGARRLVIDLSAVEFIDSSGLGAIVGVLKHMGRKGTVELACITPPVLRVFKLTRMTNVFQIHDEVPMA